MKDVKSTDTNLYSSLNFDLALLSQEETETEYLYTVRQNTKANAGLIDDSCGITYIDSAEW